MQHEKQEDAYFRARRADAKSYIGSVMQEVAKIPDATTGERKDRPTEVESKKDTE